MLINFRKWVTVALFPFVHVGKEEIHNYMQHEVSIWAG